MLKLIYMTFLNTISSLLNVGSLMLLFVYIYAVMGIALFAEIKMQDPMHERLNFQNISNAFTTLLIVATNDGWNEFFYVIGGDPTGQSNVECIESPTFEDYIKAGKPVGCGNFTIACLYFFSYSILISIIFLNLFIAIILSGYFDTK